MSIKEHQIKSKLIVLHQCLTYIHKLTNSQIISELFRKFAINFKYFRNKQDRHCIAEPKPEGMPCTFENKLFTKTSV